MARIAELLLGPASLLHVVRTVLALALSLFWLGTASATPSISTIDPDNGYDNVEFTITGSGFLPSPIVTLNGQPCPIVDATDTMIVARVPYCATTGAVEVTVGAESSIEDPFFYVVFSEGFGDEPEGPEFEPFISVNTVEFHKGKVHAVDRENGVVVAFDEIENMSGGPEPTVRLGQTVGVLATPIGLAFDDDDCIYFGNNSTSILNMGTVRRSCPPSYSSEPWGKAQIDEETRRCTRLARKENQVPFYPYFNDPVEGAIIEIHPSPEVSRLAWVGGAALNFNGTASGLVYGEPETPSMEEVPFVSTGQSSATDWATTIP